MYSLSKWILEEPHQIFPLWLTRNSIWADFPGDFPPVGAHSRVLQHEMQAAHVANSYVTPSFPSSLRKNVGKCKTNENVWGLRNLFKWHEITFDENSYSKSRDIYCKSNWIMENCSLSSDLFDYFLSFIS